MRFIKRIVEYLIRHLNMNLWCVKIVDKFVDDRENKDYEGARDLLKEVYRPVTFSQKITHKCISHKYNLQIIIPMYNVRQYISECLDSVLNQNTQYTYIIYVVDDGSTDGTLQYVEKYYHNEKVRLIHSVKGGTAVARNVALENLEADYVMFVDADDRLKQNAIDKLLSIAYEKDADVVEGGYEVFHKTRLAVKIHDNEELAEACGKLWGFSWAKVIKSDLFYDLRFPEKYWYEDTFISYLIYTRCVKTIVISDIVYSYRKTRKGMSHIRVNDKKMLDAFWIINLVLEEMIRREIPFTQSIYEQLLLSIATSTKRILYLDTDMRRCVLSAYSELLHMHFNEYRTKATNMSIFEKVIRNNDYKKYRYIAICMESL